MIRCLSLLLCCCTLNASAQLPVVTEHYIVAPTGEKKVGKRLIYEAPILRTPAFDLDGLVIETPAVAFFQNNHGYFANLARIHGQKTERYAIRIRAGKLNLFEEIDMLYYGGDALQVSEGDNELLAKGEEFQYFNAGSGPVLKANYVNLRDHVADNAVALKEVRMIRKLSYLQVALISLGAGTIGYEILRQKDSAVQFTPGMAAGIVVGGSSYFLSGAKENARWLTADAYNRE
jgi:hypothetical protein